MITIRRSSDRGHADHGWLDSYHTFSFANYHDPEHVGFHALRVLNDDRVAAGRGFGAHAHRDMEILSYVLSGKLAHKDSMGNTETLGPNEIQRMSAGTGVIHSEFNGSDAEPVHFLQIWIEPDTVGNPPSYEQYKFEPEEKRNRWKMLASNKPQPGAVSIRQDAQVYLTELSSGSEISRDFDRGRAAWVHVVSGEASVNGEALRAGDAAAVSHQQRLRINAAEGGAEVLVFDLA
jgi:redox-sensitive bicupin YhaK (pirin superfamily)